MWNSIIVSRRLAELCIHIPHGQQAGRRREEEFPATERLMQITLYGEVSCVKILQKEEIDEAYEKNTGVLMADRFEAYLN